MVNLFKSGTVLFSSGLFDGQTYEDVIKIAKKYCSANKLTSNDVTISKVYKKDTKIVESVLVKVK